MSRKHLKPRDKVTQRMTRDGVVLENQTTGEEINISDREAEQDFTPGEATGRAEKVLERADQGRERRAGKRAAKQAGQVAADASPRPSARLQFSEEERSTPELKKYIHKSDRRADRLDAARAAIPKETVKIKEKVFDEATGRAKTRVRRETRDKPPPTMKPNPASRPVQEVLLFTHGKIHEVEHENVGVEGGHKGEELAERQAGRAVRGAIRRHRLKPYRELSKAERMAEKANIEYFYQKSLHDNPQLAQAASNPISRFWQKRQIKQQYIKAARAAGQTAAHGAGATQGAAKAAKSGSKAAKEAAKESERLASFAVRHWKRCLIVLALLIMTAFLMGGLQSCSSIIGGFGSGFTATSYLSDDADLIAVENAYVGMENALQTQIDNIPSTYPGYDEYRYDLDEIMHNPHELASFLTSILPRYTLTEVQAELQRVFAKQYTLTTTTTVEVRYRTETRTDSEGNDYDVEVPYNYYILNVKLSARSILSVAPELLTPEQLDMFNVYLETSGNNPLVFGGGSPDISASEDISGVHFVNGTRPGNTAVVDIAKSQVGNVNGQPYWSWYGFDSRVAWCACFVSWCYNQVGLSEPRFSGCTTGGMAWFQSRGPVGQPGVQRHRPRRRDFLRLGQFRQRRPCGHRDRHRRHKCLHRGGQQRKRLQDQELFPEQQRYPRLRIDELGLKNLWRIGGKSINIVSFGGGTNSAAVLVGLHKHKIPVDLILFADTGGEQPHTYQFVRTMDDWLAAHGMPQITVVEKYDRSGHRLTLEMECLRSCTLPSIAYGHKRCSQKHKIGPQEKFCNHYPPCREVWARGEKINRFLGYDTGEMRRYEHSKKFNDTDKKYINRYPLIEDWGWDRSDCVREILAAGLPLPGKSSCFFCPSMKQPEILALKEHYPDLYRRAVAMEDRAMPHLTSVKGLGRNYAWREQFGAADGGPGPC